MEQVIQVTGLCVVGALLALVVKRGSPETALLLAVGAAVVVALALAGVVKELLAFLGELGSASGVSADLFVPLYKTIGIALVVQVGGNLCRDAGESALASVVETAGTLCALLAALPLLRAVLDNAAKHGGSILTAPTKTIPYFNFEVPTALPGVDPAILDPRDTYPDAGEWDTKAKDLASRFVKNFSKYAANEAGKALVAAGPKAE